ncbi:MAG: hypothetical protein AB1403_04210 [Candidatus Riflebacteria bacterium]
MKIFLNTAMFAADFDYRWFQVNGLEMVEISKKSLPQDLLSLICLEKKSIALKKSNQAICLGLGGLASVERKRVDFAGRKIRNSLVLVAESDAEVEICRLLALAALKNWQQIEHSIDLAFEEAKNSPPRIIFHSDKFGQLLKGLSPISPDKSHCFEKFAGRVFPAGEAGNASVLQSLSCCDLMAFNYPIFVYHPYETKEFFIENKIWLGISELEKTIAQFSLDSSLMNKKLAKTFSLLVVGMFLISILMMITMFVFSLSKGKELPKPSVKTVTPTLKRTSLLAKVLRFFTHVFSNKFKLIDFSATRFHDSVKTIFPNCFLTFLRILTGYNGS